MEPRRSRHLVLGAGVLVAILGALTAIAAARPAVDFATLDRQDGTSRVAVDVGASFADGSSVGYRFDLWGQYVLPNGLGFYGDLPAARLKQDGRHSDALDNLEVGVHYVMQRPGVDLVFRGGVSLPTAADSYDGYVINRIALTPRWTDFALIVPDGTYARISFSPVVHGRLLFFRADAGLDTPLLTGDQDNNFIGRVNLGAGALAGPASISAEVVTIISSRPFFGGEQFLHTAAVSARVSIDRLRPFLCIGLPLDDSSQVSFFLAAGLQILVP